MGLDLHLLRAYALVGIQGLCLYVLVVTGPLLASRISYLLLETAGVILALWALWNNRPGNFNISPIVKEGGTFIHRGPYKIVRHPMYAAVLLVTLAWVLNHGSLFRWIVWAILLCDLVIKLMVEEQLLGRRYTEYVSYKTRTKRLIPFLF